MKEYKQRVAKQAQCDQTTGASQPASSLDPTSCLSFWLRDLLTRQQYLILQRQKISQRIETLNVLIDAIH